MGRIQGEKHEQISAEQSRQVMVLTADPWKFFFSFSSSQRQLGNVVSPW
jgi:hypothetical protein